MTSKHDASNSTKQANCCSLVVPESRFGGLNDPQKQILNLAASRKHFHQQTKKNSRKLENIIARHVCDFKRRPPPSRRPHLPAVGSSSSSGRESPVGSDGRAPRAGRRPAQPEIFFTSIPGEEADGYRVEKVGKRRKHPGCGPAGQKGRTALTPKHGRPECACETRRNTQQSSPQIRDLPVCVTKYASIKRIGGKWIGRSVGQECP